MQGCIDIMRVCGTSDVHVQEKQDHIMVYVVLLKMVLYQMVVFHYYLLLTSKRFTKGWESTNRDQKCLHYKCFVCLISEIF